MKSNFLANAAILLILTLPFVVSAQDEDDNWKKAMKLYEDNVRTAARYPVDKLKRAIEDGDTKSLNLLLDEGVPASCPLPWPEDSWEGLPPTDYPIHLAARSGHIEIVRILLDHGADPNTHGCQKTPTPLHLTEDIEVAKLLISRGADVNARDDMGGQPIHYATVPKDLPNRRKEAVAKSLALIKLLIAHGADPLAKGWKNQQPIHVAAQHSTAEVVTFFIDSKAKVDTTTEDGNQPLHLAAARVNAADMEEALEVTELLIRKGADVNAVNAEGETPLHLTKNASMTKLLLQHGAKPDVMSTGLCKEQPIHVFSRNGDVESIKLLLERGVEIEAPAPDNECVTPLDTAAYWERTNAVKFLLDRGAKPTERTMKNARRFDTNPIEILQILHNHGGRVSADNIFQASAKDRKNLLPMLDQQAKNDIIAQSAEKIADAAQQNDLDLIRDLVSVGAKQDQPWNGLLPIHYAVGYGEESMIEYFLSSGQPIDAKGTLRDDNSTPPIVLTDVQPIHLSIFRPAIIPFLIRKGAKIDAQTGEGWQPIHIAAAHGETSMVEAVIKAGGNPFAKTRNGMTPLLLAEKHDQKENTEFLRKLK